MKIEAIKKPQTEGILEMENLGKRIGRIDTSINNRIQKMEERILGVEDKIEKTETSVKEAVNIKIFLTQIIQEI